MARKGGSMAGTALEQFDEEPEHGSRKALVVAGIVVIVLAAAYVGLQALVADKIPAGTSVAGVSIGGLTPQKARQVLRHDLKDRTDSAFSVTANGKTARLDPKEAGLSLDVDGTVQGLTGFTLDPTRLVHQVMGSATVAPDTHVDEAELRAALKKLAPKLEVAPVNGTVSFVDGDPVSTKASEGARLDVEAAVTSVSASWLTAASPLPLPASPVPPDIDKKDTDAALAEAKGIAAGSVWVKVAGQRAEIPASALTALTTFTADDGELHAVMAPDKLSDALASRTNHLERKAKKARFVFTKKGHPRIKGGKKGKVIDGDALASAVLASTQHDDRTVSVDLVRTSPRVTKASLKKLGVKDKVAEFATPLTAEPIRTANLALAAKRLTGTLVRPGETFSVTDAIGPITKAVGYKSAHILENGIFVDGVGGGLSQMATTTYNVGFFAGMTDVEHKPHSYWFSRYPAGREATIYVGTYDMRWRNDSPYGVLLRGWVGGGKLHVAAWSTKYYKVTTTSSPHRDVVQPDVLKSTSPRCQATPAGNPGFVITVSRKVTVKKTGKVVSDTANTWRYKPEDKIECVKQDDDSKK